MSAANDGSTDQSSAKRIDEPRSGSERLAPEPRWPATIALLAIGMLQLALPRSMTAGPPWTLLVIVCVLLIPIVVARRRGLHRLNHLFGLVLAVIITAELIVAVLALASALPAHTESPVALLRAAATLWVTNVLVFAYWYWKLDAGGPNVREARGHQNGAFFFPQFLKKTTGWRPGFIDYLFLAFTTSTAFSPTDTPVLSQWAKVLMMLQATIAFTTVTVLIARAINIL
ncbi:MAG TPA: DUF1345 domain-containing protein [Trinickia sp.]|nr:DUF1345 domain-containing protein [Trinickia sp.]